MHLLLLFLFGVVQELAGLGQDLRKPSRQKLVAHFAEIIIPAEARAKFARFASVRIKHQLHVLQVIGRRAGLGLSQHLGGVSARGSAKFAECRKEVVVP